MTLTEFDRAVESAVAVGDLSAVERLLAVAEQSAARAVIRCGDHPRYRGASQPRNVHCRTCWTIYDAGRNGGGR